MVVGECARIWQVQSVVQAPRFVIARRPQADVAISGRHCPSERAIVKTATAPDLSLRRGAADVAISGRHCLSERAIVKTATAPDLSLRGGRSPTWQSREGTSSSYKVPIKTYQPIASVAALTAQPLAALPPYGCGVPLAGSERLAGWQYSGHVFYGMRPPSLSFRGAKRRGNLREAVALSPMAFLRSDRLLRDCRGSCGASQ